MAMRVYATASDYRDFIGDPEPEEETEPVADPVLNALLRRASIRIDSYTRTSRYNTDTDGYPTDADIAEAFKWATCAQAVFFTETEDITGADSISGLTKIGSVQLGGSGADANGPKTAEAARLAPEAVEILRNAGLLSASISYV